MFMPADRLKEWRAGTLQKQCRPEVIAAALEAIIKLLLRGPMWGRYNKKNPKALVKGVEKLVSLPEVYASAREKLSDPFADAREIAHIISQDADLTARLLRMANSAVFGLSAKVETVTRAITVVGLRQIESLVLATVAVEAFAKLPVDQVNMASFWRHSLFTAVISRILARECHVLHAERLFVAGLLHDIGTLILYHEAPELATKLLAHSDGQDVHRMERELLGFDHADVGAALAQQWLLPAALEEAIGCHHRPGEAKDFLLEAAIVHVANMMAHAMELKDDEGLRAACDPVAWNLLHIGESRINPIFQEALREFLEVLDLLQPGAARPDRIR